MIITRAPYRASFFGGGTDYPKWYHKYGGAVISTTLDRYCYLSVRRMPPFLGTKYRIFWSKMESVDKLEDIEHAGVRGCLQAMNIVDGIEVNHAGDLPARSGLGSSSSFTVAMLQALYALKGEEVSKTQLTDAAIYVEQSVLKETVGIQDQIAATWGGFNLINIDPDGSYVVYPIMIDAEVKKKLESRLLLFFTGTQRCASDIAKTYANCADMKKVELSQIASLTTQAILALEKADLDRFGELLHEAWMVKKSLSYKVSNDAIDDIYNKARRVGALGGKLLGAGGGGFMLLYSPEPDEVRRILHDFIEIPFRFGTEGSKVILCEQ